MKDKKKIAFLSLALTALLALSGCGGGNNPSTDPSKDTETTSADPGTSVTESTETTTSEETTSEETTSEETTSEESSSEETTTSEETSVANVYTVRFLVDGEPVKTYQVEEGQTVVYDGETPTKAADAEVCKYVFKGWDKDVTQPIVADTDFNATFRAYALKQEIDDFEGYETDGDLKDAGWKAQKLNGSEWTFETTAEVKLSTNATNGKQAARLNAWDNNVDFKIVNHELANKFTKSANVLKFSYMIPSFMATKVLVYTQPVEIGGTTYEPKFDYTLNTTATSEYVDYSIPLADDGWKLWGKAGESIAAVADWLGINVDDFPLYIAKIEFWAKGPNYSGQKMIAFLDNVRFETEENPANSEVEKMGSYSTYTATLTDGHTLKLELGAEGAATAKVIDLESPVEIPGTVAVNGKEITFTSADSGASLVYTGKMLDGGQKIDYVSAEGTYRDLVVDVDLMAVQVVDNFEQYAEDGISYYDGNKDQNNRSGARGAYYSEFYNTGATQAESPYGGNGWHLMGGDGSQLKLKQEQATAHAGKNYLCMKNSSGNAMRYMQWGLFDGTAEKNSYRGSTFSFWAKTNKKVPSILVRVFSQTKPTLTTQDEQVRKATFTESAALDSWKHYTIELNPKLTYYGFQITLEKNQITDSFLYIDDVEIYTADPYAEYVPPEPPVEQKELANGQVFYTALMGMASATLTIKKDNACDFYIPYNDSNIVGTYSMEGNVVTFDFDTYGTLVSTLDEKASHLTFVSATGFMDAFGELDFGEVDVLDNAETYTESGKMYYQSNTDVNNRSGARGAYFCDYYSGGSGSPVGGTGWSLMGGSGDQLSLETNAELVHGGTNSLKMKRNYGAAMRYMTWGLMDGTADAHTGAHYFVYYAKNPNAKALTIKTSVYFQGQVTPSTQQSSRAYVEAEIPANSDWVQVVIPLDSSKTYYGVAFTAANPGGSGSDYFYIDDQAFVSDEMNILAPFVAIDGLALTGTTGAGEATITLGKNGTAKLTNATLGTIDVKFTLIGTTMTIKIPAIGESGTGTTLVGLYGPSETEGYFAFKVTSCTGDLATYIAADTVFTGPVPGYAA